MINFEKLRAWLKYHVYDLFFGDWPLNEKPDILKTKSETENKYIDSHYGLNKFILQQYLYFIANDICHTFIGKKINKHLTINLLADIRTKAKLIIVVGDNCLKESPYFVKATINI